MLPAPLESSVNSPVLGDAAPAWGSAPAGPQQPQFEETADLAVKMSVSDASALAFDLFRYVTASIEQQGALPERWEQLEKDYSNQPSGGGVELIPGQPPRCLNITQPRVDQLVGAVCGPLTAQDPYFHAKGYNRDESDVKVNEATVHFLLREAGYERQLRIATRVTCMAEPAAFHFQLCLDTGVESRQVTDSAIEPRFNKVFPRLLVIHPKHQVFYPAAVGALDRAVVCGRCLWKTREEIRTLIESGEYLDYEIAPLGENPQSDEAGRRQEWSLTNETIGITNPDHFLIRCYELIFKKKLKGDPAPRYYRAILAFRQKLLLRIERYEYSRPWLFEHFLHEEYEAYYRANPVTQNLQQIQQAYNDLMNLMIDGSAMCAFPAGFTQNRMLQELFVKYEVGTIYIVDGDPKVEWIKPQFDPTEIPPFLQELKDMADAAIRMSQAGMGSQFKSGMTATEASGILQGQQAGLDEYRANASFSGVQLCEFIRELAYIHFGDLVHTYGDDFPCQDREQLARPLMWEASGKSSENLPQTVINKLQVMMTFFQPFLENPALMQSPYFDMAEVVKVFIDSLNLPVPTDKILRDPQVAAQMLQMQQQQQQMAMMGGPPNGAPGGPGPAPAGPGGLPQPGFRPPSAGVLPGPGMGPRALSAPGR